MVISLSIQDQMLMFVVGYFVVLVCVLAAASKRRDGEAPRCSDGVSRSADSVSGVGWAKRTTQAGGHLPGLRQPPKPYALGEVAAACAVEYAYRFCKPIRFFMLSW
jgi:hypothetical protein